MVLGESFSALVSDLEGAKTEVIRGEIDAVVVENRKVMQFRVDSKYDSPNPMRNCYFFEIDKGIPQLEMVVGDQLIITGRDEGQFYKIAKMANASTDICYSAKDLYEHIH